MRVELLYTDADPNYMTTRQRLVEVLTEDAFETPIQMIAVATPDDAALLGMAGSPTIRIDGVDVLPPNEDVPIGLTCRVYRARDGRIVPVPDPADVRDALEAALARSAS
jgi:hypothetical protein